MNPAHTDGSPRLPKLNETGRIGLICPDWIGFSLFGALELNSVTLSSPEAPKRRLCRAPVGGGAIKTRRRCRRQRRAAVCRAQQARILAI